MQSSPRYLRGSGGREVDDWKKGGRRPLSMPLAPDAHTFKVLMLFYSIRDFFFSWAVGIYLICVSEYEPSWQNVLEGVTAQIPDLNQNLLVYFTVDFFLHLYLNFNLPPINLRILVQVLVFCPCPTKKHDHWPLT